MPRRLRFAICRALARVLTLRKRQITVIRVRGTRTPVADKCGYTAIPVRPSWTSTSIMTTAKEFHTRTTMGRLAKTGNSTGKARGAFRFCLGSSNAMGAKNEAGKKLSRRRIYRTVLRARHANADAEFSEIGRAHV